MKRAASGGSLRAALAVLLTIQFLGMVQPRSLFGWSGDGHRLIARLAASRVPADLPDFFRGGSRRIADASVEPDTLRIRSLPQLRSREYPEHYVDLEFLEEAPLPPTRYEFLETLEGKKLDPGRVGMVPYAVVEATQRLAVGFAEHRLRPDDPDIQARVLFLAGVLSHYSADMSQPLHTTLHHNGRARPDGSSPGTGIHHLVDSLVTRAGASFEPAPCTPWPAAFEDLGQGVGLALAESHALVDRVYELEAELQWSEDGTPSAAVQAFADERLTAAVLLTARLFATAWQLADDVVLPEWRLRQVQKQAE